MMHPDQLAALLKDPGHVGEAVIQLRALLPLCNVSGLVSLAPHLLHPPTLEQLPAVRPHQCSTPIGAPRYCQIERFLIIWSSFRILDRRILGGP